MSLKPCKAAELVATHFSEQIEAVIKKLKVNIVKMYWKKQLMERQLLNIHLRTFDCSNFFN